MREYPLVYPYVLKGLGVAGSEHVQSLAGGCDRGMHLLTNQCISFGHEANQKDDTPLLSSFAFSDLFSDIDPCASRGLNTF